MSPVLMIDCQRLNSLHRFWTSEWHGRIVISDLELPWSAIQLNHHFNFLLWHEEDIARRDDIPLSRIRDAKRSIDRYNQQRNDFMEVIDGWVLHRLDSSLTLPPGGGLHSETPGMMIDRLSIMALKEFHMREQACRVDVDSDHVDACLAKVDLLVDQQSDLTDCLEALLAQLASGEKRFKVYRQLKMYNDPGLNPQLYGWSGLD